LQYKIYSDGKGDPAKKGQFLKMNLLEKLRDSTLNTTYGGFPFYLPVDSPRPIYSPIEIFSLLRKGDSAVVILLADSLQSKSHGQLPPFMRKKDKLIFSFKVLDIFTSQDLLMTDRNQELAKEKDREVKAMEKYLADSNITAEKTEKGTYVVVKSPGDGVQADSGKQVSVRYTGRFFPSGKVFESNMSGPGNEPLKFVVASHQIIPGWDDGIRKFKKGGKGTLYIPGFMAYDQQPGPGHKPFESLIFDIEIVDVTDAPPPSAQQPRMQMPMRPGQMPMRPGQMPVRPGQQQVQPQQQPHK